MNAGTDLRIAVLGAGANGASIGADLADAGLDVVLLEQWPAHVEEIQAHGVTVHMPHGTKVSEVRVMHFCDIATLRQEFDLVLMLVKAYDSGWAARLIEPYLADDGLLIGVQNGMTVDRIAEAVGAQRTMGCVIEVSSMMFEPGVVERHSPPDRSWFALGSIDGRTKAREEQVAAVLSHSGTVEIVDDIVSTKWMKLVSNCETLVTSAILGLPMLDAHDLPGMRDFMLRCGAEALRAGKAQGYETLPIFGLEERDVADWDRVPEVLLDTLLEGFVLRTTKTTILQDWMKGRRSEVLELNGRVVRELGRDHAPANASVVDVARRVEEGVLEPRPENLDLLLASS